VLSDTDNMVIYKYNETQQSTALPLCSLVTQVERVLYLYNDASNNVITTVSLTFGKEMIHIRNVPFLIYS
jgi:hypothetical protein